MKNLGLKISDKEKKRILEMHKLHANLISEQDGSTTTTTTTNNNEVPTETESKSNDILDMAKNQIGIRYKWGGTKPTTGFDCSGLVTYVTGLPRKTAHGFYTSMKKVEKKDVKPGDFVFFGSGSANHAGIVKTVDENGNILSMIHARGRQSCPGDKATPNCKVEETTNMDWYKPILGYRRS